MKPQKNNNQFSPPFLSLASLSFISGIILAALIKINFFVIFCFAACLLIALICLKGFVRIDSLIILLFLIAGALRQSSFATIPPDDVYYLSRHRLKDVYVTGKVASQVQEGPYDSSFVFCLRSIRTKSFASSTSGRAYVKFNKRIKINYGDELAIEGKLYDLKNEGYFNQRLVRQGIRSALSVARDDWIEIKNTDSFSLQKLSFQIKEKLKKRFDRVSAWPRGFLIAFILGDRSGLSKDIYSVFKYTGTVHILAISGLHIGIIIFILLVFLKALRIKLKLRFVLTVIFLLFYSFMTGLRPSVVRAVIMGTTFLLSFLVKREYHVYNSLALAAMIILAIWPWQVFDIGFQLSFVSVLSIVFISPKILSILPKTKNRPVSFIGASFVVSLSAWLGATPLIAYCFGMVSLIALIANVFIVLLLPFIIAGGFIYLLASFLSETLAQWLALSLESILAALVYLAVFFKNIPLAYFYVERFPVFILFAYYVSVFWYFHNFRNKKRLS